MSKGRIYFMLGLAACIFVVNHGEVAASENDKNESAISISIIERDLALEDIQLPNFGKHQLNGKQQSFKSTQDLVFRVKDSRDLKFPWKVSCSFTPNALLEKYQDKIVYRIGKGQLKIVTLGEKETLTPVAESSYEANTVEVSGKNGNTSMVKLVPENSEAETWYEYRVKKNQITFEIPANLPAGIYDGTQVLQLADVPE